MGYIGRFVGVGKTRVDQLCGVYAITGRAQSSKARRLKIENDSAVVKPISNPTSEQRQQAEYIFYPAIKVMQGMNGCALLTNGIQTKEIWNSLGMSGVSYGYPWSNVAYTTRDILNDMGAETDGPDNGEQTPRIMGFVGVTGCSLIGMVTPHRRARTVEFVPKAFKSGEFRTVSTYSGESSGLDIPDIRTQEDFEAYAKVLHLEGVKPADLARELYEKMSPEYVVATAVTVYDPKFVIPNPTTKKAGDIGKWDIAVKNRR